MNEGWACFWHYRLINDLYDEGLLTDEFMIEFLQSHTNVIAQQDFDSKYYSGLNPYALGYAMMTDLRRICENPTEEDLLWFPDIANTSWLKTLMYAMKNFKDESFIAQYLSPKLIRDFRFFSVLDDDQKDNLLISNIHDEGGYRRIRQALSDQYNLGNLEPNIQVYNVDYRGDRSITLRHLQSGRRPLSKSAEEVLKHLHVLWGFDVRLDILSDTGEIVQTLRCPPA